MSWQVILAWFFRFLHIASAICAVGGPFFVRYALMPAAAKTLDEPAHHKLRQAINARWKIAVFTLIALFLLTGFFNYFAAIRIPDGTPLGRLITARWKDFGPDDQRLYHLLLGVKILCAFVIFFHASALAGESPAFAPIRKHARTSITLLLFLAALVVACSTMLRFLPLHPAAPAIP